MSKFPSFLQKNFKLSSNEALTLYLIILFGVAVFGLFIITS